MELQQSTHADGTLHASNIGGIQETTVDFSPGVTILAGRNATNRTSFIQAVMAGLGSDHVSIKGTRTRPRWNSPLETKHIRAG